MQTKTTIFVVRHGETDNNRNGIYQGQMDVALNERGRAQAAELAPRVRTLRPDVIVHSPLQPQLGAVRLPEEPVGPEGEDDQNDRVGDQVA